MQRTNIIEIKPSKIQNFDDKEKEQFLKDISGIIGGR